MTKDRENFLKIYKWMIDLPLERNDLLVYALIYNMSNSSPLWVRCSVTKKYIQNYFNISKRTVERIIKKLELRNLIISYHDGKLKIKIYYASKQYAIKLIEQMKQSNQLKLVDFEN